MPRLIPDPAVAARARRASQRARLRADRRRAWPRWVAPALRYGAAGLSVAFVAGVGAWLWRAGWVSAAAERARSGALNLTVDAGLRVREVLVEGRAGTDRDALMAVLKLKRGDPILDFSPSQARAQLEQLPWVGDAVVERRLPDTIYIRLIERQPMALWQRGQRLFLIDERGSVLSDHDLGRYPRLPILVGDDAPAHAKELFALLAAEPVIGARVEAATWIGGRRWDLHLNNGVDIRLPQDGAPAALHQLATLEARTPFLDRDVLAIDLRLPDRLVVRTSPAGAERRRMPDGKA
jgi:cell division protein FtsQ